VRLDADILDEVDEGEVKNETEQADIFKGKYEGQSLMQQVQLLQWRHQEVSTCCPPTLPAVMIGVKLPKLSLKMLMMT